MMKFVDRLRCRFKATPPQQNPGKVFISGTGRAGTTLLVELLTELGLDTGFDGRNTEESYFPSARAGLEWDLDDQNGPRFQKSPYLCDRLNDIINRGEKIATVIVPVRNISDATKSRLKVQLATTGSQDGREVAGGLWSTNSASEQEAILRQKLTMLIEVAVANDVSITFLSFPKFASDSLYLYTKLLPVLGQIEFSEFEEAFRKTVNPSLISNFHKDSF